jgi:transcriptional regulator of acetoin/glycerol metabolism
MRQLITKLASAWRQRCARQHKADLERMLSGLIDARHRLDDEIEHTAELLIVANHHLTHLNTPANPAQASMCGY